MAISKSTPYVRYKENFSSTLHLGTIHIESEYLDRTQKTTIESIHGMTWHNKVVNENKELNLLSDSQLELTELERQYFDTGEKRVSVDEVQGLQDVTPNEDGTYTYTVSSMEGEYAEIYQGYNNITSTSDALDGNFEIVYDTDEEDITGNIALDAVVPTYTIENSGIGVIDNGKISGLTLVNNITESSSEEIVAIGEHQGQYITINNAVEGNIKSAILKGQTLVNISDAKGTYELTPNKAVDNISDLYKNSTTYTIIFNAITNGVEQIRVQEYLTYDYSGSSKDYLIKDGLNIFTYTTSLSNVFNNIKLRHFDTDTDKNLILSDLMIIEGDHVNEDIPYFEGMQSVKMPVLTTSNIIQKAEFELIKTNLSDGSFVVDSTSYTSGCVEHFDISKLTNAKFVFKTTQSFTKENYFTFFFYDKDMKYIEWLNGEFTKIADGVYTSTIPTIDNAKYLRVCKYDSDENMASIVSNSVAGFVDKDFNVDSTFSIKSNTLTVNEEVELRGIGNIKDELNLLTGELTQRVDEVVLNGSENIKVWGDYGFYVANITVSNPTTNSINNKYLSYSHALALSRVDGNGVAVNSNNLYVKTNEFTSLEEFTVYLQSNPIRVQYPLATESVKTVDLTILDQDNNPQDTLHTFDNVTYISTSSDGLTPVAEVSSSYDTIIKPNTTYTIKLNRPKVSEDIMLQVDLGGTVTLVEPDVNELTIKTPSTLLHNQLKLDGIGNSVKEIMVLEGSLVNHDIKYFEGMKSVENPVLSTINKNRFNKEAFYNDWKSKNDTYAYKETVDGEEVLKINNFYHLYADEMGFRINVKKGVSLRMSMKCKQAGEEGTNAVFTVRIGDDGTKDSYKPFPTCKSTEWTEANMTFTPTRDYITICSGYNNAGYFYVKDIQIEEGTQQTEYTPHKSNTLTPNEPIQLRGIGNVKDEYNPFTGEYIQRIGEVVFDGSEDWQKSTANGKNAFTIPHYGKAKGGVISLSDQITCATNNTAPYDTFFYIGGSYFNYLTTEDFTRATFKEYLSQNPLTIQYQLAEPIISTVDHTILDQNNKQAHNISTYPETTHVSVTSDGLIPSSNLDYEITSSTGTITGTSATIENGENGTPISAIVYGESLVNNLQEHGDIEYVALGEHSGSNITIENSVAGNIKNVVIKGDTLVNIVQPSFKEWIWSSVAVGGQGLYATKDEFVADWSLGVPYNAWLQPRNDNNPVFAGMIKPNVDYTVIINILENNPTYDGTPYTDNCGSLYLWGVKGYKGMSHQIPTGVTGLVPFKYNINQVDANQQAEIFGIAVGGTQQDGTKTINGGRLVISKNVLILEGDYTESYQDIPYFDGIGSVKNYNTVTNIQPTCTYSTSAGTYWCDTVSENPVVGAKYFIKIFNNPDNKITRFYWGGVLQDTTTGYAIITPTDSTGNRLHFYDLTDSGITEDVYNQIRFVVCEYQDGMETWEFEHFEGTDNITRPIVKINGKNLFDVSMIPSNVELYSPYEPVEAGTIDTISIYPILKLQPNTTYTFSINSGSYVGLRHVIFGFRSPSKQLINISWGGSTTYNYNTSFTTDETGYVYVTGYLTVHYKQNLQDLITMLQNCEVQLEKGSTATTYEPYQSTTLTLNEPIELRKIGDVQDEFDCVSGKLTTYIKNGLLDGTETWTGVFNSSSSVFTTTKSGLVANSEILYDSLPDGVTQIGVEGQNIIVTTTTDFASISVSNFTNKLKESPIPYVYASTQPIATTPNSLILDQDNNPTTLQSYDTITHISTNSQGLTANVDISNPTYNTMVKVKTTYTLKVNRTNTPTDTPLEINLGGTTTTMDSTVSSVTITTPSTLTNKTLTLGGFGNKFKNIMVIEGEYVDRDLNYFDGIISVENPMVMIHKGNLWSEAIISNNPNEYTPYEAYVQSLKPILKLEPNTRYRINAIFNLEKAGSISNSDPWIVFQLREKQIDGTFKTVYEVNHHNTTNEPKEYATYGVLFTTTGILYLQFYPAQNEKLLKWGVSTIDNASITIFKEGDYVNNAHLENTHNTLTTYPQIELHGIGDVKDELDLVNETVTRRIGKVVLDGSEDETWTFINGGTSHGWTWFNNTDILKIASTQDTLQNIRVYCNHLRFRGYSNSLSLSVGDFLVSAARGIAVSVPYTSSELREKLKENPITIYVEMDAPTTESIRITPPNPETSTASITLSSQLNHVDDTSDFVVWNPYKEHYVRYNYIQDGTILDQYTWENLTDLNERQFINLYNRRTYVEQEYENYVVSHDSKGTSKYVLIEPNQDYTVSVRFSELPECETVKVNLGGSEVEMNVSDPHVHVTTPNTLLNNLCSISGDGLDGKITDILVIHCLEHEGFADIDYFEGIDSVGEIVDNKVSIVMEQTNGNLLDFEPVVFNNGNYISMAWGENNKAIPLRPNKNYVVKFPRPEYTLSTTSWGDYAVRTFDENLTTIRTIPRNGDILRRHPFTTQSNEKYVRFHGTYSENGSANVHVPIELCYAEMEKDETIIRPRYYDKQEITLPMQLCRINTVYDNFYYDEVKGFYRIQQSIGHKYFTGADSENWTLIENGQRVLRFRYNNADIQIKSLGEYMTNRFPNGTATSPYESCAFNGSTFIVSIDKERLSSVSLIAFKEWLANNNLHLYYQLASPLMIDLPEYSSRLEFNTYKDEIFTFFKNCKPTVFTLGVPLDQTYRFYELEEGQGYANRVELTDERMTEEDTLYIDTIHGSGISNLIEEPNNVNTMLKPNYEGKATSHTLTNGKVSTIGIHGFEPNGAKVGAYNTSTKRYELTIKAVSGANNNSIVFPIPYALEQYEDGTHDRVYYNKEHKQWMFEGKQTLTVEFNSSTGAFTNPVEVFRGMAPRSGMIGEFKVRFASGTTSARLYYSLDGSSYGYTTLRSMTDEVDYYIGFFNTGGTKIDMATKIGAESEYTTFVPLSGTVSEALMINQIQSITECTYYLDKTHYYTEPTRPVELTVYNGSTTITEDNGAIITIENNAHNKEALIYDNTTYTVYWTYVGGEGNVKVTLGGVTKEVPATQGYVTITTSSTDLERGLFIGGFDVTIKDLMLVKGERIVDLSYFEGSRAVGTAFTDEDGNTMYRITLVTGSELIQDKFEDSITFEDNKKHNVVVTKLLGAKPDKN